MANRVVPAGDAWERYGSGGGKGGVAEAPRVVGGDSLVWRASAKGLSSGGDCSEALEARV